MIKYLPIALRAFWSRARSGALHTWLLVAAVCPVVALAQAISITTPQLPPRATAPASTASPADPGGHPGSHGVPAAPAPAGGSPYGGAPVYAPAAAGGGRAPASPLQQHGGRGGFPPAYPGQAPGADSGYAAPSDGAAIATPSQPGGTCRAQPSPERHSVSLLGPDGLPRSHVPLGEFRVQFVSHSPDGQWAVAVTKLRGQAQYAATAIDLARCVVTHTVALAAAADEVRFDGAVAMLRMASREQRLPLADPRVR
jgi:hypothetical protein